MGNKITVDDEAVNAPIDEQAARRIANEELNRATQGIREDFIVIFGVFASILIFLGVEVQILKSVHGFAALIGFSLFLLGSLLAFLFCIHGIVKQKATYSDYKDNPIAHFILACFLIAFLCFLWIGTVKPILETYNKNEQETFQKTN